MMEQYLVSRGIDVQLRDFAGRRGSVTARGGVWRWQMSEQEGAGRGLLRYQVDEYPPATDDRAFGTLLAFFTRPGL